MVREDEHRHVERRLVSPPGVRVGIVRPRPLAAAEHPPAHDHRARGGERLGKMREVSGLMGGIHLIAEWFMRFTIVNILWVIINLPITIIVLSPLFNDSSSAIIMQMMPALLLFPILLFPSTSAMFGISRDWLVGKEQKSLIKTYFSYFKENYKRALLSGTGWGIIWVIWMMDLYFFSKENDLFTIIFIIIGLILFVMNMNFFSLTAHYRMGLRDLFKNSFFLTFGMPFLSFLILMLNFFIIYISTKVWFLLPFFSGSISVFLSFYVFYKFTLKVKKKTALQNS